MDKSKKQKDLNSLVAFWFLGLCNNYGYVVMLSAANDILKTVTTSDSQNNPPGAEALNNTDFNSSRDCNLLSTGIILLADIIPCLIIKLLSPFLPLWTNLRMMFVVALSAAGFIIVALADTTTMAVMGVAATSLGSGLGESTLLPYTVFFPDRAVLTMWSSGTGGAGFFGSFTYAGLTFLGLTPTTTLFVLLIVPITMAVNYWLILSDPFENDIVDMVASLDDITAHTKSTASVPSKISEQGVSEKMKILPSLLKYMIPIFLVYVLEYFINQGLFELMYFKNIFLDHDSQYRWYQVFYQIGVFISRSSTAMIRIDKIWLMSLFQFINLIFFSLEAVYSISPTIFLIFLLITWEGLLGGAAYVNTYYKISSEITPENREFATGITALADSIGISIAGLLAIPAHNYICTLPQ